jgi:hypothetical protein
MERVLFAICVALGIWAAGNISQYEWAALFHETAKLFGAGGLSVNPVHFRQSVTSLQGAILLGGASFALLLWVVLKR